MVVAHDAVPHEADLWQWCQDVLTREVERIVSDQPTAGEDAAVDAIADLLGRRPAEMHQALAGGADRIRAGAVHAAVAALDPPEPARLAA